MVTKRPVFLNLMNMSFPITAIVSILHRITGVVLFLCLPFCLWLLSYSLQSASGFEYMLGLIKLPIYGVITWLAAVCLSFHALAGIRHLFMDIGKGETLVIAKYTAWIVIVLSILNAVYLGVCLLW